MTGPWRPHPSVLTRHLELVLQRKGGRVAMEISGSATLGQYNHTLPRFHQPPGLPQPQPQIPGEKPYLVMNRPGRWTGLERPSMYLEHCVLLSGTKAEVENSSVHVVRRAQEGVKQGSTLPRKMLVVFLQGAPNRQLSSVSEPGKHLSCL